MIPIEVRHPASATAIREQGATEFLNPNVRAYAEAHGLYTRKAH
jgi:hypothetical protein